MPHDALTYLAYFVPDNPLALVLTTALFGLFALGVVWYLVQITWVQWRLRASLRRWRNVAFLSRARLSSDGGVDADEASPAEDVEATDPAALFERACADEGLSPKTPIAQHVRMLLIATWRGEQVEAAAILDHTEDAMFPSYAAFRTVAGLFLVVGLLGTLVGLADSLASLQPVLEGHDGSDPTRTTQAVGALLSELGSAFAPSLVGVLSSILATLSFVAYQRFVCGPIGAELERLTRSEWIPYLTASRDSAVAARLQARQAELDSAREFTDAFTAATDRMDVSAGTLQSAVEEFHAGVAGLSDVLKPAAWIGEELKTLREGMVADATHLRDELQVAHRTQQDSAEAHTDRLEELYDGVQDVAQYARVASQEAGKTAEALTRHIDTIVSETDRKAAQDTRMETRLIAAFEAAIGTFEAGLSELPAAARQEMQVNGERFQASLDESAAAARDIILGATHGVEETFAAILAQLQSLDTPMRDAAIRFAQALQTYDKQLAFIMQHAHAHTDGQLVRSEELTETLLAIAASLRGPGATPISVAASSSSRRDSRSGDDGWLADLADALNDALAVHASPDQFLARRLDFERRFGAVPMRLCDSDGSTYQGVGEMRFVMDAHGSLYVTKHPTDAEAVIVTPSLVEAVVDVAWDSLAGLHSLFTVRDGSSGVLRRVVHPATIRAQDFTLRSTGEVETAPM